MTNSWLRMWERLAGTGSCLSEDRVPNLSPGRGLLGRQVQRELHSETVWLVTWVSWSRSWACFSTSAVRGRRSFTYITRSEDDPRSDYGSLTVMVMEMVMVMVYSFEFMPIFPNIYQTLELIFFKISIKLIFSLPRVSQKSNKNTYNKNKIPMLNTDKKSIFLFLNHTLQLKLIQ